MLAGHTFSCSKQRFWVRQARKVHPFDPNSSKSMLQTLVSNSTEMFLQIVFNYPNFGLKKPSNHETSSWNCASQRCLLPLELALVPILDDLAPWRWDLSPPQKLGALEAVGFFLFDWYDFFRFHRPSFSGGLSNPWNMSKRNATKTNIYIP